MAFFLFLRIIVFKNRKTTCSKVPLIRLSEPAHGITRETHRTTTSLTNGAVSVGHETLEDSASWVAFLAHTSASLDYTVRKLHSYICVITNISAFLNIVPWSKGSNENRDQVEYGLGRTKSELNEFQWHFLRTHNRTFENVRYAILTDIVTTDQCHPNMYAVI